MERLAGWKRIVFIIVGVYVVVAVPLIILNRLHIFSLSNWLHLQPGNSVTYTQVTDIAPVPSGDPYLQPVQPSGAPFATVKLFGKVATIHKTNGTTFLSIIKHDNEQIKEVLALTPDVDVQIINSVKGKNIFQVGASSDDIKLGDEALVTYQINVANKTGSISAVTIFR